MEEVEKKKPGPTPKPKVEWEQFEALLNKVDAMERVIAKMAHQSGVPNSLFIDNGLKHYVLDPKEMKKYAS